jgi:hypothetical protein
MIKLLPPVRRLVVLLVLAVATSSAHRVSAQAPTPVFEFESALDTFFDGRTGTLRFGDYTVAFAPEGPFRGEAAVVNSEGQTVARMPFHEEYKLRAGVFGRVAIQGPGEVKLAQPGVYNLIFLVDRKPVTRVAFAMRELTGGDDPFNPQRTFVFEGLWPRFAHVTYKTLREQPVPNFTFWVGQPDLPPGSSRDMYSVALVRDGEEIARTKKAQGHIAAGHYKRTEFALFFPHEDRQAHAARPFMATDLLVDGEHELRVVRQSDGKLLRTFVFTVADGAIVPLERTGLAYQPRLDYIAPRVAKKNVNVFDVQEAVWLEAR